MFRFSTPKTFAALVLLSLAAFQVSSGQQSAGQQPDGNIDATTRTQITVFPALKDRAKLMPTLRVENQNILN